ncbi:MAG: hypothetical protein LBT44_06255 [Clostridiales bacterium]|jgi:hypothetical protein|nr:hypothetical protein [Clostridiales bacterium]
MIKKICAGLALVMVFIVCTGSAAPMFTAEEIKTRIGDKARLITPGMSAEDYSAALETSWKEVTFPEGTNPTGLTSAFNQVYSYAQWEKILIDLAKHSMAHLYEIGETQGKRKIYCVEIGAGKKTVLLSAGVHANEIGSVYLLYQLLYDKVLEAEKNESARRALTEDVKYAAVVAVNPDGYDYNAASGGNSKSNNQYGGGKGIDINRSFPVCFGGFHISGVPRTASLPTGPASRDYSGPSLGCAQETRALMKFFDKYIVKEHSAAAYIDVHQQGRVVYLSLRDSKMDDTGTNRQLGKKLVDYLGYSFADYDRYGNGQGGTTVRMAMDYSFGFQMSPFGVMGLPVDGEVLPAVLFRDMPNHMDYYPDKRGIPCITLEITRVDYSKGLLRNITDTKTEYKNYRFGGLLDYIAGAV